MKGILAEYDITSGPRSITDIVAFVKH